MPAMQLVPHLLLCEAKDAAGEGSNVTILVSGRTGGEGVWGSR